MRILVTGAEGVIGKHLVPYLSERDNTVAGMDIITSRPNRCYCVDITKRDDVHEAFESFQPDTVIHMAGEVGRLKGETRPDTMIRVNNMGTLNIILECLESGSRLVNFSTSEVYGNLFNWSNTATEDLLESIGVMAGDAGPTNVYGMSKLMGEALVRHYVTNYDLNAITIRPFMIYGPGEPPLPGRSAMVNWIYNALNDKPLVVHNGTVRSWCHVWDFIRGVEIAMKIPFEGQYEAFNIGTNEPMTANAVAAMVIEEAEADPRLLHITEVPTKFISPIKMASILKIMKFGYKPVITTREGIRTVINYLKGTAQL